MNTKMQEKKPKETIWCSYDIMYSSYVAVLLAYSESYECKIGISIFKGIMLVLDGLK